jgi:hypothetical protein
MPTSHSENKNNGTSSFGCEYLAPPSLTKRIEDEVSATHFVGVIAYKFGIISMQPKYENYRNEPIPKWTRYWQCQLLPEKI